MSLRTAAVSHTNDHPPRHPAAAVVLRLTIKETSCATELYCSAVAYPGGGGSTNSVEDRGQRERGSGGGSPLSGVLEAAVIWYKKFHFI